MAHPCTYCTETFTFSSDACHIVVLKFATKNGLAAPTPRYVKRPKEDHQLAIDWIALKLSEREANTANYKANTVLDRHLDNCLFDGAKIQLPMLNGNK